MHPIFFLSCTFVAGWYLTLTELLVTVSIMCFQIRKVKNKAGGVKCFCFLSYDTVKREQQMRSSISQYLLSPPPCLLPQAFLCHVNLYKHEVSCLKMVGWALYLSKKQKTSSIYMMLSHYSKQYKTAGSNKENKKARKQGGGEWFGVWVLVSIPCR